MRASSSYEAGENGQRSGESRELLRLLEEAGFAIAWRNYAPGEAMGDPEGRATLYVLTSGVALLPRERSAGREATLGLLKEWDVFGTLWSAGGTARGVQTRAVTPCEVAVLPRPVLEAALRRDPRVALKLLTLQDVRLARYEEFVVRIAPRSILVRLAGLLLSLSEGFPEEGSSVSRGVTIEVRFTHEELAAMVNASREAVSLAMGQLRRQGAIEAHRGAVVVVDHEKLRNLSSGDVGKVSVVRAVLGAGVEKRSPEEVATPLTAITEQTGAR
jgi:CRP-like cAMP-binding protein